MEKLGVKQCQPEAGASTASQAGIEVDWAILMGIVSDFSNSGARIRLSLVVEPYSGMLAICRGAECVGKKQQGSKKSRLHARLSQ